VVAVRDSARARAIAVSIEAGDKPAAKYRASALLEIARVVIGRAPERAAEVLAEAESQARMIDEHHLLLQIGQTLAQIHPASAARIADAFDDASYHRAQLLGSAARAFAERDPARAARLFADAERDARGIEKPYERAWALTAVAISQMGAYPECLMTA